MTNLINKLPSFVFQKRVYVNFHIPARNNPGFSNLNYLELLQLIGKYYYGTEVIRSVCRQIKEEYNKLYHFNRIRHRKKAISANQVEALAFSFKNIIIKDDVIIRIPFATVPLLYFILSKYKEIVHQNSQIANKIDNSSIGDCLCARQIETMRLYFKTLPLGDEEYREKCERLYDDLVNRPELISMNWHSFSNNRIDYVKRHWEK